MKIPEVAKCVFQGIFFDVYHWPQDMYDGSTRTFEMLKRKPSVDIIATQGDRILLTEEEQPNKGKFVSIPGGQLEEGESFLACAKRELLEETGYYWDNWVILRENTGPSSKIAAPKMIFVARNVQKITEQQLDGGERISFRFVSYEDFLQSARQPESSLGAELKLEMYEALLDPIRSAALQKEIFWDNI